MRRINQFISGAGTMPRKSTFILGLVLLTFGVGLRLWWYLLIAKITLNFLLVVPFIIVIFLLLTGSKKQLFLDFKDVLYCVVVFAILWGLSYESPASNKRKNQEYLERLSGIINIYTRRHNTTPMSFDEALEEYLWVLPNRGDADGNPYSYIRISDRIYILRTLGPNGRNDFGQEDDAQICHVAGNAVTFDELSVWIDSQGTSEERGVLEVYRPFLQANR